MKYFFDNNISHRVVKMLCALDVDAVALRAEFSESIEDIPLFEELKGRDVVFVANDMKQLTRELEARALKAAGITAIYFGPFWSRLELWQQATWIVTKWPTIDGFVRGVQRGTIAEIRQQGRAVLIQI